MSLWGFVFLFFLFRFLNVHIVMRLFVTDAALFNIFGPLSLPYLLCHKMSHFTIITCYTILINICGGILLTPSPLNVCHPLWMARMSNFILWGGEYYFYFQGSVLRYERTGDISRNIWFLCLIARLILYSFLRWIFLFIILESRFK